MGCLGLKSKHVSAPKPLMDGKAQIIPESPQEMQILQMQIRQRFPNAREIAIRETHLIMTSSQCEINEKEEEDLIEVSSAFIFATSKDLMNRGKPKDSFQLFKNILKTMLKKLEVYDAHSYFCKVKVLQDLDMCFALETQGKYKIISSLDPLLSPSQMCETLSRVIDGLLFCADKRITLPQSLQLLISQDSGKVQFFPIQFEDFKTFSEKTNISSLIRYLKEKLPISEKKLDQEEIIGAKYNSNDILADFLEIISKKDSVAKSIRKEFDRRRKQYKFENEVQINSQDPPADGVKGCEQQTQGDINTNRQQETNFLMNQGNNQSQQENNQEGFQPINTDAYNPELLKTTLENTHQLIIFDESGEEDKFNDDKYPQLHNQDGELTDQVYKKMKFSTDIQHLKEQSSQAPLEGKTITYLNKVSTDQQDHILNNQFQDSMQLEINKQLQSICIHQNNSENGITQQNAENYPQLMENIFTPKIPDISQEQHIPLQEVSGISLPEKTVESGGEMEEKQQINFEDLTPQQKFQEYFAQGITNASSGNMKEAVICFQAALKYDPRDLHSRLLLAEIFQYAIGDFCRAKLELEQVITIDKNCTEAYFQMGYLLCLRFHRYELAKKYLEVCSMFQFNEPASQILLGNIAINGENDPYTALKCYELAAKMTIESDTTIYQTAVRNIVYVSYMIGDYKKAETLLKMLSEKFPDSLHDANFLNNMGVVTHKKNIKSAIQLYNQALSVNPNHLQALLNLSNILKETDKEQAKQLRNKIKELNLSFYYTYFTDSHQL